MDVILTEKEIRVLGCLMEKEMATPEYYPLSLNALTNACNQKSNRDPVTSYSEETVFETLESLRKKGFAMESSGSRVPKYAQTFSQKEQLTQSEEAVMCTLFVRGPQTPGEVRGRTERLYSFSGLEEVNETIGKLVHMELLVKLPREPGRKESRYAHTLSNVIVNESEPYGNSDNDVTKNNENRNISDLLKELESLRKELNDLRAEFEAFKSQFG